MEKQKKKYQLTPQTVDVLSQVCEEALESAKVDRKDIIRLRLSLEEILEGWLNNLSGAEVVCEIGQRFGKQKIEFRVKGEEVAFEAEKDTLLFSNTLLAQTALALVFSYHNGSNCLSIYPPKKTSMDQMQKIVIAIFLSVLCGFVTGCLPSQIQSILQSIADPLFNMLLGMLRSISSPMIFLAVCWGIINIGDVGTVERIGGRILLRMLIGTFVTGIVSVLLLLFFFPMGKEATAIAGSGFKDLYQLILDIVPPDIVTPFQQGNALQIIFMGVCVGGALLVLGERVSVTRALVDQTNTVVEFLMGIIGGLVPLFIFLSIYTLIISDILSEFGGVIKGILLVIAGCALLLAVYIVAVSLKYGVNVKLIIHKLLPTFLIALTTASSAAAFGENIDTCQNKLGLSKQISNFAVPLGQVVFMPAGVVAFLGVSFTMAQIYGVIITPVWILTAVLVSALLAMATSPVPGGALTCYTVLFSQLGIPSEALALAISIDMLLDFVITATNLSCLQTELTLAAGKLGVINTAILKKGE